MIAAAGFSALRVFCPDSDKEIIIMQKKCNILALCSLILALGIFVFSYILFHYTLPDGGFTSVWQPDPGKPLVCLLFSIWGVTFLFASVMSLMIGRIFFRDR